MINPFNRLIDGIYKFTARKMQMDPRTGNYYDVEELIKNPRRNSASLRLRKDTLFKIQSRISWAGLLIFLLGGTLTVIFREPIFLHIISSIGGSVFLTSIWIGFYRDYIALFEYRRFIKIEDPVERANFKVSKRVPMRWYDFAVPMIIVTINTLINVGIIPLFDYI